MAEHRRGGLYVIPTPVYLRKKVAMPPEFFYFYFLLKPPWSDCDLLPHVWDPISHSCEIHEAQTIP